MRRKKGRSGHDRELDERLRQLERNPFCDPVAADHTDEYPDPEPVNGHIPDIKVDCAFGGGRIEEVEHRDDTSQHTRDQHSAFQEAADSNPGLGFEVEYVDDQDDGFSLF